jgi:enoyl-CoA hydratase
VSAHSTQSNDKSDSRRILTLERRGKVAVVTLDRPPVNAVDGSLVDAVAAAARELADSTEVGAVAWLSAGRIFSAGADLKAIRALVRENGAEAAGDLVERMQAAFSAVAALPMPVVAGIRGAALGGGLELALACDLRIAAADAKIGLPEFGHGLLPGAGGTQRLTRAVGPAVAAGMMLTGEVVDGAGAAERGIVQWAVSAEEVDERALALAERLAASPIAARAIKRCITLAEDPEGYELEITATRELYASDQVQQRLAAF